MRKDLYQEMYELEETYWWHVAKRMLVKKLLSLYINDYSNKKLVDIGCGTGKFLQEMNVWQDWQALLGLDGSDEAIKFTKERKIAQVKKADFETKLPIKSNSYDVVTSLDVVEHINDDQHLIHEFYRVLKPGGIAIITVPAHQWLWTYWDEMLGHYRRHNKQSVSRLFNNAGFTIEKLSYFYSYLLPIALIFRALKSRKTKDEQASDFIKVPQIINMFLLSKAFVEKESIKYINIPFGLSVVCVAKKQN